MGKINHRVNITAVARINTVVVEPVDRALTKAVRDAGLIGLRQSRRAPSNTPELSRG
jgi:hypothetical protein